MDNEDDLDELLDEVEKKFCRDVSVTCSARADRREAAKCVTDSEGRRKHSATKPEQPMSSITDDIDALLEELLEDDDSDSTQIKTEQFPKGTQAEKKLSSQSGGRKCCPVFVGGSAVTNGVGTATSKRACDQLRCTSCDFRLLMFDDCEWDLSCDYLFFRNNMPDRQKLRAKLKRRRGFRAYACQCSWFSTSAPTELREQPQLRWVCGKHLH
ncbi:cilia- and flagella-associated protein 418 [Centropristis striata]|uniref:cilia- and flagella-associated protein 418 n=1 Tax=Centropristis striata TaxID=184440 RepID=UPI0027E0574D|nr:cilia- and flagella-associated protein 418 [Centropristis striata]